MNKIIVFTMTKNSYPTLSEDKLDKSKVISYMILSAFFLKELSLTLTQSSITELWKELMNTNSKDKVFDRTSISNNPKAKEIFNILKNDMSVFIFDFVYIKELFKKVELDFENDDKLLVINKISEEIKDYNNLKIIQNYFDLLKDLDDSSDDFDIYCQRVKDIVERKIIKDVEYKFIDKEILSKIGDLLDLSVENSQFRKIIPEVLNLIYSKNSKFEEADFIKDLDIQIIQENLDLMSIINDDFNICNLIQEKKENFINISNNLEYFIKFTDIFSKKKNLTILSGKEGSGKTILSLKMCLDSSKFDFYPIYININNGINFTLLKDNILKNKKNFIVIDDLYRYLYENSTKINQIKDFIEDLVNNLSKESVILINLNVDNISLNKILLSRFSTETFFIEEIKIKGEPWISTIMEKVIFEQLKTKITNSFDLHYNYIDRILENCSKKISGIYSDKSKLKSLLGEIAFKLFLDPIKIQDYNFTELMMKSLSNNTILTIDNLENGGNITFKHPIFQSILASDYLMIDISPEELSSELKNQKLEESKWKQLMLILSQRISNSNKSRIQKKSILIKGILYHLRQQRDLENEERIIDLIDDEYFRDKEKKIFLLDKARNLYNKYGDYINSVKYTFKSLKINTDNLNLDSEALIHLSSCAIDLFFPKTAISILDSIDNNILEDIKINLLGNYARAYLKLSDFGKTEKYFIEKFEKHKALNLKLEVLRDQADLILFYSYLYRKDKNESILKKSIDLSIQTINSYNDEENLFANMSGRKAFVYRNLSYFLPYLSTEDYKKLSDFFIDFENNFGTEKFPLGIYQMNLGLFNLFNGNTLKAKELFEESSKNLITYKEHLYINFAIQFFITREENFKDKALENYNALKLEANEVKKILQENLNFPEETFILENIFNKNDILDSIREIIVF